MGQVEEKCIVSQKGYEVVINNIPKKYINNDHKLMIRLKENYTQYDYLFKKMINIENEKYTFNVGDFGYYEYEIFNCKNEIVSEDDGTFIKNVNIILDTKTRDGTVRTYFKSTDEEFQENTMILVNKMEKTYFEQPELKLKIGEIFDEIKKNATDFVYIQDPYFDYNFYRDLIEKLPNNLVVKVLYAKNQAKNIPPIHNMTLIEDDMKNGHIHDRYIVTQRFGYYIGISLNGMHKNKSSFNKIFNITDLLKYFKQ